MKSIPIKPAYRYAKQTILFVSILFLGSLSSCYDEPFDCGPVENKESTFQLTTHTPGMQTRALTGTDENNIQTLDVLIFEPNKGAYTYHAAATAQVTAGRYSVKLIRQSTPADIIVLANARQYLSLLTAGDTYDDVATKLAVTLSGKWNSDPQDPSYIPIPMWGFIENASLATANSSLGQVNLTRMLTRVNIEVEDNNFTLTSIHVYNTQDKGQIIPDQTDWDFATGQPTQPTVVGNTRSTPLEYSGTAIAGGKCENEIYLFEAPAGSSSTFPAYPCFVVGGEYEGQTSYYRIDLANRDTQGNITHFPLMRNKAYQINIVKIGGKGYDDPATAYKYLPVNVETSVVQVEEIGGIGVWTDGQYTLTVDKPEYTLSKEARGQTDKDNQVIIRTDFPEGWRLETIQYPAGTPAWITFQGGNQGIANNKTTHWLEINENSGSTREATLILTAGRIRARIPVTQTDEVFTQLIIRDKNTGRILTGDTIRYTGTEQIGDLPLEIEWFPKNVNCQVSYSPGSSALKFEPGVGLPGNASLTGGTHDYDLKLSKFNFDDLPLTKSAGMPTPERNGTVTFTIASGGTTIQQTIQIKHQYIYLYHRLPAPYRLDAINNNVLFFLNSRVEKVTVEDPHQILTARYRAKLEAYTTETFVVTRQTRGDNALPPNSPTTFPALAQRVPYIEFDPNKNTPDWDDKAAYATFYFKEPGVSPQRVEILATYCFPNCYIVNPGGRQELPVMKAWRAWKRTPLNIDLDTLDMGKTYGCHLVWEDVEGLIKPLSWNYPTGVFDKYSKIVVETSPGMDGNAVIAFTRGGEIKWTWHIWVTAYNPDNPTGGHKTIPMGVIMDRNVGALTNTRSGESGGANYNSTRNLRTQGLMYQWGRKDPFPPVDHLPTSTDASYTFTSTYRRRVYPNNAIFTTVQAPGSSSYDRVKYSIENPTKFMIPRAGDNGDWYGPPLDPQTGRVDLNRWTQNMTVYRIDDPNQSEPIIYYKRHEYSACPVGWSETPLHNSLAVMKSPYGGQDFFKGKEVQINHFGLQKTDGGGQFYPSSGYIRHTDGRYIRPGTYMYVWTNTIYDEGPEKVDKDAMVIRLEYEPDLSRSAIDQFDKGHGAPIRCIREDFPPVPWDQY